MHTGKLVFAQLTDRIHPEQFHRCVRRYHGDYKVMSFSCWSQFLCMAFGQLTFRDSLRDVETCLRSRHDQRYHLGIRGEVSHRTLADANRERDWRIYYDLAQRLIRRARVLYQNEPMGWELNETVYALDSTTIDLGLNLFPWARFRRTKGALKRHTRLDLQGSLPTFISISPGKMAEVRIWDELVLEPGACYVMDRSYVDFYRLYNFVLAGAFFVTRSKARLQFIRLESRPVDSSTGVRSDHIVRLRQESSLKDYPAKLRQIHYVDPDTGKSFIFLPNNFVLPALTIALLYKKRWQVELFFKWIKQHLRIKHFYGTSENAVKTQIWIAICVYVLVAIVKKQIPSEMSLHSILQILSVNAFAQEPLPQVLTDFGLQNSEGSICNQLEFRY